VRTTLDIDEDVLAAARERARREKTTAGRVLSYLARQALTGQATASRTGYKGETRTDFRPFPSRGGAVTNEAIDVLRDQDAY
jgi:hypothetical protein